MERPLLIPELHARVTLLNDKNEVVAKLGEDVERVTKKVKGVRNDSKNGFQGKFIHTVPVSTRMVIFSLQNGCRLASIPITTFLMTQIKDYLNRNMKFITKLLLIAFIAVPTISNSLGQKEKLIY